MRSFVVFFSLFVLVAGAQAEPPYRLDPTGDWLLVGSGCALTVGGLIAYNNVEPLTLDEIASLDRADINRFDRGAVRPFRGGLAGDIATGLSVVLPFALLGDEQVRREWKTLGLLWGETLLLESGVNAVIKSATHRVRPYVYDPDTPLDRKTDAEARVSFYSGHTGTAAAMSFLAARMYDDYFPRSRYRTLVWTTAAVYPALIGIHRIRSGQHFASDVIAGYVTGAAIGYFIPALHKSRVTARVSVEPTEIAGSSGLRLTWRY
jgi:membrane-associated phospholipid phosphatase